MSYYLVDFSKKTNDYNFDNLIIGKRIKMDHDNFKYYMYYQSEQTENPSELYIRLPKLRLIYNIGNNKYDKISIPIYPNWDLTNGFIEWIEKFESDIQECYSECKIKREFISILTKKNMLNFIKCYINENLKITSNIDDKKITLSDFKINGQIELVIKLSYIWANNTKYGLSSSIYQIKYYAPPDQLDINFIDSEPQNKKYNIPISIPLSHVLNYSDDLSTIKYKKQEKQLPVQNTVGVIPSLKDLEKAIKKLKPVEDTY